MEVIEKGKVVPVHAMEEYRSGGTSALLLNFEA
jgi:hypothetical protein